MIVAHRYMLETRGLPTALLTVLVLRLLHCRIFKCLLARFIIDLALALVSTLAFTQPAPRMWFWSSITVLQVSMVVRMIVAHRYMLETRGLPTALLTVLVLRLLHCR